MVALIVIGIAFVFYGVTVMLAWSGTPFFAVWYVLGAACVAVGLAGHVGILEHIPALVKRCVAVVVCVGVLCVVIFTGMALSGFGAKGEPQLDCIVVLGAQAREDGPSAVLQYRLDTAAEYLKDNPQTRCIVSGGQGHNEPRAEAQIMAAYLADHGVAEERIAVEDRSLNTSENIVNSMQLLDARTDRVGIVTNDFHVYRGVGIAKRKGIANVCGIAASSNKWFLPNNLLREAFGIAKDYAAGNL